MLQPVFDAVAQLSDRVFLGVIWRSLVLSMLAFAGLLAGSVWLVQLWVAQGGWLGWLIGSLGGLAVLLLAIWLYVPVALLIATLYLDRIAGAVERRYYPGLPRPVGAPLTQQGWDGVVLALQVLA
ncbi:MAG: EI24 domain-containing protein, partial [Acetobacteraceae bacterium]|nr:EI24 domain-containing protein [Acetobacteraceae bacterium]